MANLHDYSTNYSETFTITDSAVQRAGGNVIIVTSNNFQVPNLALVGFYGTYASNASGYTNDESDTEKTLLTEGTHYLIEKIDTEVNDPVVSKVKVTINVAVRNTDTITFFLKETGTVPEDLQFKKEINQKQLQENAESLAANVEAAKENLRKYIDAEILKEHGYTDDEIEKINDKIAALGSGFLREEYDANTGILTLHFTNGQSVELDLPDLLSVELDAVKGRISDLETKAGELTKEDAAIRRDFAAADATTLQSAKDYANSGDDTTLQAAKDYFDSGVETVTGERTYMKALKDVSNPPTSSSPAANITIASGNYSDWMALNDWDTFPAPFKLGEVGLLKAQGTITFQSNLTALFLVNAAMRIRKKNDTSVVSDWVMIRNDLHFDVTFSNAYTSLELDILDGVRAFSSGFFNAFSDVTGAGMTEIDADNDYEIQFGIQFKAVSATTLADMGVIVSNLFYSNQQISLIHSVKVSQVGDIDFDDYSTTAEVDAKDADTLQSAKDYADTKSQEAKDFTYAKGTITSKDTDTLNAAKADAATKADAAQAAAQAYADSVAATTGGLTDEEGKQYGSVVDYLFLGENKFVLEQYDYEGGVNPRAGTDGAISINQYNPAKVRFVYPNAESKDNIDAAFLGKILALAIHKDYTIAFKVLKHSRTIVLSGERHAEEYTIALFQRFPSGYTLPYRDTVSIYRFRDITGEGDVKFAMQNVDYTGEFNAEDGHAFGGWHGYNQGYVAPSSGSLVSGSTDKIVIDGVEYTINGFLLFISGCRLVLSLAGNVEHDIDIENFKIGVEDSNGRVDLVDEDYLILPHLADEGGTYERFEGILTTPGHQKIESKLADGNTFKLHLTRANIISNTLVSGVIDGGITRQMIAKKSINEDRLSTGLNELVNDFELYETNRLNDARINTNRPPVKPRENRFYFSGDGENQVYILTVFAQENGEVYNILTNLKYQEQFTLSNGSVFTAVERANIADGDFTAQGREDGSSALVDKSTKKITIELKRDEGGYFFKDGSIGGDMDITFYKKYNGAAIQAEFENTQKAINEKFENNTVPDWLQYFDYYYLSNEGTKTNIAGAGDPTPSGATISNGVISFINTGDSVLFPNQVSTKLASAETVIFGSIADNASTDLHPILFESGNDGRPLLTKGDFGGGTFLAFAGGGVPSAISASGTFVNGVDTGVTVVIKATSGTGWINGRQALTANVSWGWEADDTFSLGENGGNTNGNFYGTQKQVILLVSNTAYEALSANDKTATDAQAAAWTSKNDANKNLSERNTIDLRNLGAVYTPKETKKDVFISPAHLVADTAESSRRYVAVKAGSTAGDLDVGTTTPTPAEAGATEYLNINIAIPIADWDKCHKVGVGTSHATSVMLNLEEYIYKTDLNSTLTVNQIASADGRNSARVRLYENQNQLGSRSTTTHRLEITGTIGRVYIGKVRLVNLELA